jgi:cell division protein ZipA
MMQANWSLILNVLLLIGVIVAIARLMKARKKSLVPERYEPTLGVPEKNSYGTQSYNDDIIAVRKVDALATSIGQEDAEESLQLLKQPSAKQSQPVLMSQYDEEEVALRAAPKPTPKIDVNPISNTDTPSTLVMFLLARENRQFAGYELLQTVLATGLRFGEGHLFHRHQFANGQGPVLFSLAAATATGVFDLQNIGAFSVRGLCLYMHSSKSPGIDVERFSVMLETAKQLSEGLNAHLLDDQRQPLTEARIARYHRLLQINQSHFESATV